MRTPKIGKRNIVIAPLVIASAVVTAGFVRKQLESPCVVAKAWVEEHRSSLPTTLAQMATYPTVYRKAIYSALTIPERRGLWRAHLESFLGPTSILTAEQQDTVRAVLSRLDRYVNDTASARRAIKDDGLRTRLRAQFGDSLSRAIFASLGPREIRDDEGSAGLKKAGVSLGECSCSYSDDWCLSGSICLLGGAGCTFTQGGCGLFWCSDCTGQCGYACDENDTECLRNARG